MLSFFTVPGKNEEALRDDAREWNHMAGKSDPTWLFQTHILGTALHDIAVKQRAKLRSQRPRRRGELESDPLQAEILDSMTPGGLASQRRARCSWGPSRSQGPLCSTGHSSQSLLDSDHGDPSS